jgi:hypothetical protein
VLLLEMIVKEIEILNTRINKILLNVYSCLAFGY